MNLPPIDLDPPADVIKLNVPFKAPVPQERYLVAQPLKCSHHNGPFLVDKTLAEVTCGTCKEKLNPMWVLLQMAHKETRWHEHFERYQSEMKRLAERSKTKCRHCGQMTPISPN